MGGERRAYAPGGPRGRRPTREGPLLEDALAQERLRIAADIHDLVMQDLALALATARMLSSDPAEASQASVIVAAGERALGGARHLLDGLAGRDRTPLVEAVETSVRMAGRSMLVSFRANGVGSGDQPDQTTVDVLVHIGREAVTNAVKHAEASAIAVTLEHGDEWCLHVRDDGRGFDPSAVPGGFGLESMRRHVEALGGSLLVTSSAEAGTTVQACLP